MSIFLGEGQAGMPALLMRKGPIVFLKKTTEPKSRTALSVGQTLSSVFCSRQATVPVLLVYAVNEVPQPQLPVAFGLVNVNPDPITPVT